MFAQNLLGTANKMVMVTSELLPKIFTYQTEYTKPVK
jgi:hypothetical protein